LTKVYADEGLVERKEEGAWRVGKCPDQNKDEKEKKIKNLPHVPRPTSPNPTKPCHPSLRVNPEGEGREGKRG